MPAIVARGISAPDMPGNIVTTYTVEASNTVVTNSASYVPVSDMVINVNPDIPCGAIVLFSASAQQAGELNEWMEMGVAIYLDNSLLAETLHSPYGRLELEWDDFFEMWIPTPYLARQNVSVITAITNLSAGQHKFQVYFRGNKQFIANCRNVLYERSLSVILFYR